MGKSSSDLISKQKIQPQISQIFYHYNWSLSQKFTTYCPDVSQQGTCLVALSSVLVEPSSSSKLSGVIVLLLIQLLELHNLSKDVF
mmetsp:Transcript_29860/g.47487  ORF Transcript_29860/g.47487 Transcript_29860/m.47487 type:complete len:86 (+) Transcript_29860:90-347(+)